MPSSSTFLALNFAAVQTVQQLPPPPPPPPPLFPILFHLHLQLLLQLPLLSSVPEPSSALPAPYSRGSDRLPSQQATKELTSTAAHIRAGSVARAVHQRCLPSSCLFSNRGRTTGSLQRACLTSAANGSSASTGDVAFHIRRQSKQIQRLLLWSCGCRRCPFISMHKHSVIFSQTLRRCAKPWRASARSACSC
jgi:hypothetical protein